MKKKNKTVPVQVRFDEDTIKRIDKAQKKIRSDNRSHVVRVGTEKLLEELGL